MNSPVLWQPPAARITQSRITAFQRKIEAQQGFAFADYRAFHRWSCDHADSFWQAVWDEAGLVGDRHGQAPTWRRAMPPPSPGKNISQTATRLNFAENLLLPALRHQQQDAAKQKPALVSRNEEGRYCTLTHAQLLESVRRLAAQMRAHGIQPGDRIAGFMPNIAEAVVAMLATTSIGAIWSSCSPDFGINGVLDRFGQIAPRMLFCADGYLYSGKEIDSLARVREIRAQISSIEKVVVVPYRDAAPPIDDIDGAVRFDEYLAGAASSWA